ncbi:protein rep, partial [Salmonella enterica subsp. enterica serovar Kentucky]|nr:protein rep [Salmonella enterica subsp. enterica serovar Kentucky]
LAVQTMLPAFYEQGYDPIMMESQFSPTLVMEHLGMLRRRNIDAPDARWMFVTLTVRNCDIADLGETLTAMNAAFQRMKDRKEFKP